MKFFTYVTLLFAYVLAYFVGYLVEISNYSLASTNVITIILCLYVAYITSKV